MPKKSKAKTHHVDFSTDRPITTARLDKLGRSKFATELARRIVAWRGNESLVIALCGEWGCGKTSLKNVVVEQINSTKHPAVDILEFNPWEISGHDSMAAAFFRELIVLLDTGDDDDAANAKRASNMRAYAKIAALGGSAVKWLSRALNASENPSNSIVAFTAQAAALAGTVISEVGEVAGQSAEAFEGRSESKTRSLVEVKRDLTKDMSKLKRPVLIVIDDLDRLNHDEIRQVFQLVKANADFPNLIYLLMFDRQIVGNALDSVSGGRGDEFLEKFVQVLFNVPQPPLSQIRKLLFDGLAAVMIAPGILEKWDSGRWTSVWASGLSHYFTNLRSVYRFLSSLEFNAMQMQDGETFELNPLDLVVLEGLRIFEPKLYDAIPKNRDLFLGERLMRFSSTDEDNKEHAQRFNNLLDEFVSADRRSRLRELLINLFPAVTGKTYPDENSLLRDLRVGHKITFARYFTLALTENDVSQVDLNAVLNNLANPLKLLEVCDRLKRRNLLVPVFERLEAYNGTLGEDKFPGAITALCSVGDMLPVRESVVPDIFSFDALTQAYRLLLFSLQNIVDEVKRFTFIKDGLTASNGVRLTVMLTNYEARKPSKEQVLFLVGKEQWVELKDLAVARLRAAAKDGRLRTMAGLQSLLYRWSEWASQEEPKAWLSKEVQSPDDALWLLHNFLSVLRSGDGTRTRYTRFIRLDEFETFYDATVLESQTKDLDIAKLQQPDQRVLRAFRQALVWRSEGKRDDYGYNSRREDDPLTEDS